MADRGLIFTGARARVIVEGAAFGFATNVSASEEIQYDPVEILDNIEVQEFVPIAYRVSLSASRVWVVGETLRKQAFFPKGGGSSNERLRNILTQKDMNLLIEDNQSGSAIALFEQVRVASHNFTIAARAIVSQDVNFVCIRMKDQSEV